MRTLGGSATVTEAPTTISPSVKYRASCMCSLRVTFRARRFPAGTNLMGGTFVITKTAVGCEDFQYPGANDAARIGAQWEETAMNRRRFLQLGAASALALGNGSVSGTSRAGQPDQVLYNGIRLPSPWPPRLKVLRHEPMAVPYLSSPPAVIPIDIGRQLFVDNFLIDHTNLTRTFHQAVYHASTPVLRPDQKWEQTGQNPMAMVFSDGV